MKLIVVILMVGLVWAAHVSDYTRDMIRLSEWKEIYPEREPPKWVSEQELKIAREWRAANLPHFAMLITPQLTYGEALESNLEQSEPYVSALANCVFGDDTSYCVAAKDRLLIYYYLNSQIPLLSERDAAYLSKEMLSIVHEK